MHSATRSFSATVQTFSGDSCVAMENWSYPVFFNKWRIPPLSLRLIYLVRFRLKPWFILTWHARSSNCHKYFPDKNTIYMSTDHTPIIFVDVLETGGRKNVHLSKYFATKSNSLQIIHPLFLYSKLTTWRVSLGLVQRQYNGLNIWDMSLQMITIPLV